MDPRQRLIAAAIGLNAHLIKPNTLFTVLVIAFTTVAAFLVFGTFPDLWAGAGMVLIVCAGLYVLHRETVRRGRPRPVAAPAP